ncbi:hypothetical protein NUU61_002722 [Penicillium alfredii]|uniref:Uncharacterized protein n=1 Tax=Penicillium alfredii TaxID=1506179 RepID=A0A9W9KGA4_9EURO|nr:uncharacterized protein NUU61_002722 [Penicillium alfredii]KAJ5105375.1 hypothetical protein NUU61_002722 [Penicillium alfredii]
MNMLLENLPPEIRLLLSALNLQELKALIRASPVFYQQYLLDRRFLLRACLQETLHIVSVDALAAYRSGMKDFSKQHTSATVTEFIHSYQYQHSLDEFPILDKRVTEEDIASMVEFHSSIIEPLARQYTDWALTNLAQESVSPLTRDTLSKAEETRVVRALYRLQIHGNLFGPDAPWDVNENNPKFDGQRPPTPDGAFNFDNSCE